MKCLPIEIGTGAEAPLAGQGTRNTRASSMLFIIYDIPPLCSLAELAHGLARGSLPITIGIGRLAADLAPVPISIGRHFIGYRACRPRSRIYRVETLYYTHIHLS